MGRQKPLGRPLSMIRLASILKTACPYAFFSTRSHAKAFARSCSPVRAMNTSLLFAPLRSEPSSAIALRSILERTDRQLQFYKPEELEDDENQNLLALCLVNGGASDLPSSLVVPETLSPVESDSQPSAESGISSESELENGNHDPPPPNSVNAINWAWPDEYDAYDNLDSKNMPDFDPDQDEDAAFYKTDIFDAWARSDDQERSTGANPRLYQLLNLSNETEADVYSTDYDPSALDASSRLSRHLLILQVPAPIQMERRKAEVEFAKMFRRYAYLTSADHYKRVSAFRQEDPVFPRWLLIQEFTSYYDDFDLKKMEVEYWWRKNGWERVLPEFFVEAPNIR